MLHGACENRKLRCANCQLSRLKLQSTLQLTLLYLTISQYRDAFFIFFLELLLESLARIVPDFFVSSRIAFQIVMSHRILPEVASGVELNVPLSALCRIRCSGISLERLFRPTRKGAPRAPSIRHS